MTRLFNHPHRELKHNHPYRRTRHLLKIKHTLKSRPSLNLMSLPIPRSTRKPILISLHHGSTPIVNRNRHRLTINRRLRKLKPHLPPSNITTSLIRLNGNTIRPLQHKRNNVSLVNQRPITRRHRLRNGTQLFRRTTTTQGRNSIRRVNSNLKHTTKP